MEEIIQKSSEYGIVGIIFMAMAYALWQNWKRDQDEIRRLQKRIDELEKEIHENELKQS